MGFYITRLGAAGVHLEPAGKSTPPAPCSFLHIAVSVVLRLEAYDHVQQVVHPTLSTRASAFRSDVVHGLLFTPLLRRRPLISRRPTQWSFWWNSGAEWKLQRASA